MNRNYKYVAVKEYILNQIHSGELKPNDKLPNEADYSEHFQVSAITTRKALSELADEGYIVRIRKKGTFVAPFPPSAKEENSHLIAVIISAEDRFDISYMKIIRGAQALAAEQKYSLIVEWCENTPSQEAVTIQKLLARRVDGFILYPYDPAKSGQSFTMLEQAGVPYVLVDRYDINHPCYFSGCNNYDGAVLATEELLRLKHTKIKFAAYHFFLQSEQERYEGFCTAMRQAGLDTSQNNLIVGMESGRLAELIRTREVTAIFCCNDRLAVKLMRSLQEQHIRTPEDVSFIGFDDWDESLNNSLGLTTIKQNFDEIGTNAAHLLISAIQGNITSNNTKILSGVSLIRRSSTGLNPS